MCLSTVHHFNFPCFPIQYDYFSMPTFNFNFQCWTSTLFFLQCSMFSIFYSEIEYFQYLSFGFWSIIEFRWSDIEGNFNIDVATSILKSNIERNNFNIEVSCSILDCKIELFQYFNKLNNWAQHVRFQYFNVLQCWSSALHHGTEPNKIADQMRAAHRAWHRAHAFATERLHSISHEKRIFILCLLAAQNFAYADLIVAPREVNTFKKCSFSSESLRCESPSKTKCLCSF